PPGPDTNSGPCARLDARPCVYDSSNACRCSVQFQPTAAAFCHARARYKSSERRVLETHGSIAHESSHPLRRSISPKSICRGDERCPGGSGLQPSKDFENETTGRGRWCCSLWRLL